MTATVQILIEKIQSLPPKSIAGVDDLVDFLRLREQDRHLIRTAAQASQPAFAAVWDNKEDEAYDVL